MGSTKRSRSYSHVAGDQSILKSRQKRLKTTNDKHIRSRNAEREISQSIETSSLAADIQHMKKQFLNADSVLKRSKIFWLIPQDPQDTMKRIEEMSKEQDFKGEFVYHPLTSSLHEGFGEFTNFSLLGCCMLLTSLLSKSNGSRMSYHRQQPRVKAWNIHGTFYVPSNTQFQRTSSLRYLKESAITPSQHFKEFTFNCGSESSFVPLFTDIMELFTRFRFGNSKPNSYRDFQRAVRNINQDFIGCLAEINPISFHDTRLLIGSNFSKILSTRKHLINTWESALIEEPFTTVEHEESNKRRKIERIGNDKQQKSQHSPKKTNKMSEKVSASRLPLDGSKKDSFTHKAPNETSNVKAMDAYPGFMTQKEIKQHCIATLRASIDKLKAQSHYKILKTYFRCPRQRYLDLIQENVADLRNKTNCNIVILHLNNVKESDPWLDSLDLRGYTNMYQAPHPSTTKIISIGGVKDHIIKALELIGKIIGTDE